MKTNSSIPTISSKKTHPKIKVLGGFTNHNKFLSILTVKIRIPMKVLLNQTVKEVQAPKKALKRQQESRAKTKNRTILLSLYTFSPMSILSIMRDRASII